MNYLLNKVEQQFWYIVVIPNRSENLRTQLPRSPWNERLASWDLIWLIDAESSEGVMKAITKSRWRCRAPDSTM